MGSVIMALILLGSSPFFFFFFGFFFLGGSVAVSCEILSSTGVFFTGGI
jgi:hypothetical protein